MKRIVLSLGGNALGNTLPEQMAAVKTAVGAIGGLIAEGHQVVLTHGNGPQVGMIHMAMAEYSRSHPTQSLAPMSVCTAMSQGYIGYDLQNALGEELAERGIPRPVATVLTQVEVDPHDPAFQNPTKPVGAFLSPEEAAEMRERGNPVMEDAGRGWRRVVASPRPRAIVELPTIRALLEAGQVVIACGGGGIPVAREGNHLRGMGAVIDKDFASSLLARELGADLLIILTAVEHVSVAFGTPAQRALHRVSAAEMETHIKNGEFAPGSMLPKVRSAVEFARSGGGREAIITLLERAEAGVRGETGTAVYEEGFLWK